MLLAAFIICCHIVVISVESKMCRCRLVREDLLRRDISASAKSEIDAEATQKSFFSLARRQISLALFSLTLTFL